MRFILIAALLAGVLALAGCGGNNNGYVSSSADSTWRTTFSGLQYRDVKLGTGDMAITGSTVSTHYKGMLEDGTVFDTSRQEGRTPFTFTLGEGQVIKGWDEGVAGMRVGGTRQLKVPPDLGYGDKQQGSIPPNSTLYFEVELLSAEAPEPPAED